LTQLRTIPEALNLDPPGTLMLIRQMIRGFWDGAPSGSVPDFSRKIGKNSYTTSGNWRLDRRATNPKNVGDCFHNWLLYHADLG